MKCLYTLIPLVPLSLVLLLGGCMGVFHSGNLPKEDPRSDLSLQAALNLELIQLDMALYHQVCLKVFEGNVLLAGRVPSKELHTKLISTTRSIPGIKKVFDNTTIGGSRDMSAYLSDAWKSTQIASKIFANNHLLPDNYAVETVDDVVYLLGRSPNVKVRQEVIDIARRLEGVKKVISYIEIENPTS